MNVIEALETRHAVKHYDPEYELSEAEIQELIRLAKLAPSSFNMQNYRFVLVKDPELRKQIQASAWGQTQVTEASLLIVMCADLKAYAKDPARYWRHAPKAVQDVLVPMMIPFYEGKPQLERDEAIRSTGLAGMAIMLAARELGYDSCPMIGFDAEAVSKIINLPADHVISFLIVVGKAAKPAWGRGERLPDTEVVIYDRFN
ncbi:MAG: nitroreductase family protein [Candidatus Caenarcaniphilales bacterium]|nr:nitroreductase family protein [Candidatus Caenarcaniphilales bacterium]